MATPTPTVDTERITGMTTTTTPETRGRIAYTAYGRITGFKNFQGDEMPTFDNLPPQIKRAWITAANVIWDLATKGNATL
jgi:hypothetical protein